MFATLSQHWEDQDHWEHWEHQNTGNTRNTENIRTIGNTKNTGSTSVWALGRKCVMALLVSPFDSEKN